MTASAAPKDGGSTSPQSTGRALERNRGGVRCAEAALPPHILSCDDGSCGGAVAQLTFDFAAMQGVRPRDFRELPNLRLEFAK